VPAIEVSRRPTTNRGLSNAYERGDPAKPIQAKACAGLRSFKIISRLSLALDYEMNLIGTHAATADPNAAPKYE
jgi:hypothetical protein